MHGSMVPFLQQNERDDQQGRQHTEPRKQLSLDLRKPGREKKKVTSLTSIPLHINGSLIRGFREILSVKYSIVIYKLEDA